jgi:hypothetical protein
MCDDFNKKFHFQNLKGLETGMHHEVSMMMMTFVSSEFGANSSLSPLHIT